MRLRAFLLKIRRPSDHAQAHAQKAFVSYLRSVHLLSNTGMGRSRRKEVGKKREGGVKRRGEWSQRVQNLRGRVRKHQVVEELTNIITAG